MERDYGWDWYWLGQWDVLMPNFSSTLKNRWNIFKKNKRGAGPMYPAWSFTCASASLVFSFPPSLTLTSPLLGCPTFSRPCGCSSSSSCTTTGAPPWREPGGRRSHTHWGYLSHKLKGAAALAVGLSKHALCSMKVIAIFADNIDLTGKEFTKR